jgi:hypothetical protein
VLTLLLILLIVGFCIGVGLFVGGLFLQGYIYTEPSPHLRWGAPVAGAVLFSFFTLWCLIVVFMRSAPGDIPFDALHRFSPREDLVRDPVKDLWAVRKGGKMDHYQLRKTPKFRGAVGTEYVKAGTTTPWNGAGVEAIIIRPEDGNEVRFEAEPEGRREDYTYRRFISDNGWVMQEYDSGPTGIPSRFLIGRFLGNLFLNGLHFLLWFLCLWLLMRFWWSHALGLAFVIWIAFTLMVVPMLLSYAADLSQARHAPTTTQAPAPPRVAHGGSKPPALNGLQRQIRHSPLQPPLIGPCLWTASTKYSLQLG